MDTRKIKKLIELVKETGVGELEVKSGDESVRINCQAAHATQVAAAPQVMAQPMVNNSQPMITEGPAPVTHDEPAVAAPEGHTISSPMVGTVYLASTPGAKPFVSVGQHIQAGDTLCIIEAMKMFNKIEADRSGVISARLIENETPVEYDQALFIIETDD